MAKGLSLHIGLNAVDPAKYGGWSGKLAGCENDARDMAAIATKQGFTPKVLLTKAGTSVAVTAGIKAAAAKLVAGDAFFLTYSGHGGQVPDANRDEDDGLDETWCLYDRQMLDDELYGLYGLFAKGVRVTVLSDSCHSGTVLRMALDSGARIPIRSAGTIDYSALTPRAMPREVQRPAFEIQKRALSRAQKAYAKPPAVKASVVLISGCQDNQTSADGARNGLFTETLLRVWDDGRYTGSLKEFHNRIQRQMPFVQSPNYFKVGTVSATFENAKPFAL
ncbi:MAG TPA: caspase family protein [Thermoanaerobaculia bacterium]|nr:caspase family protein [Thermoanaerobaculia bacterium]